MRLFIFGILLGVAFDASVTALAKDYLNRTPQQQYDYLDNNDRPSPGTLSNQIDQTDIAPDRPKRSPALLGS